MKVEREATYRKPDGEELTLADLGMLVAHLQSVGQAPLEAKVYLRVDQVRVEWSTEQESQVEYEARIEAARQARRVDLEHVSEAAPAPADDWISSEEPEIQAAEAAAEAAAADEPEPAPLGIQRGRRGRASSGV